MEEHTLIRGKEFFKIAFGIISAICILFTICGYLRHSYYHRTDDSIIHICWQTKNGNDPKRAVVFSPTLNHCSLTNCSYMDYSKINYICINGLFFTNRSPDVFKKG